MVKSSVPRPLDAWSSTRPQVVGSGLIAGFRFQAATVALLAKPAT